MRGIFLTCMWQKLKWEFQCNMSGLHSPTTPLVSKYGAKHTLALNTSEQTWTLKGRLPSINFNIQSGYCNQASKYHQCSCWWNISTPLPISAYLRVSMCYLMVSLCHDQVLHSHPVSTRVHVKLWTQIHTELVLMHSDRVKYTPWFNEIVAACAALYRLLLANIVLEVTSFML